MVEVDQIIRIKKQLSTGKFHSRIRKATGVSERTIRRIAAGQLDYRLEPQVIEQQAVRRPERSEQNHHHAEKPERCPTCFAMVYMPCLACTIEASRKRNPDACNIELLSKQDIAELKEQLDIRYTLAPDHLARALEIRELAGRKPR